MNALDRATALVTERLVSLAGSLGADGGPRVPVEGKLLRPVVGYACVPPQRRAALDDRFWSGLLAVQMVHEASLLHDDILDEAGERRGRPTLAARRGAAAALVAGDHLLTASYGAAARAGCPAFLALFVDAVERTVAGEIRQARSAGTRLDATAYTRIVQGKSGELFGCVTSLHALLAGAGDDAVREARERGLRLGALYQRVDDLLDYCPAARTGKPPLRDHAQRKWTWVLDELAGDPFDREAVDVVDELVRGGDASPGRRCLRRLETERDALLGEHALASPGDRLLEAVTAGWIEAARAGLRAQERAAGPAGASAASVVAPLLDAALVARARALGGRESWTAFFGRHSRSFRFASRLFPAEPLRLVTGVYAFCRFTDDLADRDDGLSPEVRRARMDRWLHLARGAREGRRTGAPLLDEVMGDMAAASVPFRYVEDLVEGVASDVGPVRIPDDEALHRYTYRVAGVVGAWLTELFGVRDPALLARARALGHAMQVTNIVRDVGEDWRLGRLYLPEDRMARHGVSPADVAAAARGGAPGPGYRALMEDLMAEADRHYDAAMEALPLLPSWYARPVAVAARVYQGIHDEVRRHGCDNGTRRAVTSGPRKLWLGVRALVELARRGRGRQTARLTRTILPTRPVRVDG